MATCKYEDCDAEVTTEESEIEEDDGSTTIVEYDVCENGHYQ